MKKEATKKSKLWLWLLIGLAALLVIGAGTVGAIMLLFGGGEEGPAGGRPDLYWNLDKIAYTQDSESGLSTREPGEDGVYRVRFAYNGQMVELPVVDKQLVNYIDTLEVMGLVKDTGGMVVDVILPEDFTTPVALNAYVQQVKDDMLIANSSIAMNGMQYKIELTELTEFYDVSSTAKEPGVKVSAEDLLPMDSVWVYANDLEQTTHVFLSDHPAESAVYWRAKQMWDSANKSTSRVPDENGVYSVEFCSDGGLVTLKCKDKSIVTTIDNKSPHSCHFGFVFDEEGYIIEIMNSGIGIRGAVAAERMEVTELDGQYFSASQKIPSDAALSYSATLPEGCPIYDASSAAAREGRQGQLVDSLKLGDRICVWTDSTGTPVMVYIANRLVDGPAYYNLVRKYDNTKKETSREPNWAGYYEFEMVETGKVGKVTLKTKDKELASFIDSIANRVVGLKVEDGIILNAYTDDDVFGWTSIYGGYVPQIQGAIVSLVSFSKPDSPSNVLLSPDVKCYDVSDKDVPCGTETTLRIGDIATVTRDVSYNGVVIYITRRMVGPDCIYYNLDYQYDSKKKETKRLPDEEGWYVFTMSHKGETVQVKTKNKELANKIDQSPNGDLIVVMRVVNGIAYEVYDTQAAYGQILRSGYRITSINSDGTISVAASSEVEYKLKIADDCVIYNVSPVFDEYRGERIYSLKVGDMVASLADYRGNVKHIYVRNRASDKMYVNKQVRYDTTNKVTLREPDAEGWYWFDLAVDGKVQQFKTKDMDVATAVDAYTTPFGLSLINGNEIKTVISPIYVKGVYKAGDTGWDVTSVRGSSVTIKQNKPGYSTTGTSKTIQVGSGVKVYDISPTAENFGEATKLQVGDRIRTYTTGKGDCVYVYVMFRASREKGTVAYCEHCDQTVMWHPWNIGNPDAVDCHYYLPADTLLTRQTNIGNATKDYEVVIDLNGKKLRVEGARAFLAYRGDTLNIMDSVGGGEIAATGISGGSGGTMLVNGGGKLFLYGGKLSFIDSDADVKKGAVLNVDSGSEFTMYDGLITGGIVNSPDGNTLGGNISIRGGTMNIYGGVIEGGRAERTTGLQPAVAAQGGNIYAHGEAVINLYDGIIRDGYSNQHGGNIFLSTATLNMMGGEISGGECLYAAGNAYSQFGAIYNISGGVIKDGTAGTTGNNFYSAHDTSELNITGGTITGDVVVGNGKSISISGAPKITVGETVGLSVPSSITVKLGELKQGADIAFNARGVFTEPNTNAQAYVDAGYVKPGAPRTKIRVGNDVLIMEGETSYCEHCHQEVEWNEWSGTSSPISGHYFIGRDFRQGSQITIAADTEIVLDLYGKTYSSQGIRNFLVYGELSILDTVGGGVMIPTGGEEFAGSVALVGNKAGSASPGKLNLYSGTLKLAEEHAIFNNGGVVAVGAGEMNIYGGTVEGGYVAQAGGCINVTVASATLNMYGGLVTGGTSGLNGGCISIAGTANFEGGTVEGDVYLGAGTSGHILAGETRIGTLTIENGVKVDASGLAGAAKIGVDADGVFTTDMADPNAYLAFFESADTGKDIKPTMTALEMTMSQAKIDELNAIHTKAEQMTADGVFNAGGAVVATCPVCNEEVTWNELNALTERNITEAGHYYLSADLTIPAHYSARVDFCLHLNGHNITSDARALYLEYNTVNIMGEGIVTGNPPKQTLGWTGVVDAPCNLSLYGGTYVSTSDGAAVCARSNRAHTLNIYEGVNIVSTAGNGIGVRVFDEHDFNMFGGKISGYNVNLLLETGASTARNVVATIQGGTIENGKAVQGGNILTDGETVTLNILGGKLTGGSTYITEGAAGLLLSGAPEISRLVLPAGFAADVLNLEADADISVAAEGAFTTKNNLAKDYLDAGYFKPADSGSVIREENGVLYMEKETVYCPHCDKQVTWELWPGSNSPVSGHYYIDGTYTGQEKQWSIVADTDVVLDLRGNRYITTGIRNFLIRGVLSVVDTVGGGEMVTTNSTGTHGGVALIGKASGQQTVASLNLYSGTLRMADEHQVSTQAGIVAVGSGGEFNMYGGSVVGGESSTYGGNICVTSASGAFNMYGGTVEGGKSEAGDDVYALGTFYMEGGQIKGEVALAKDATAATVAKAAKIGTLVVPEGDTVDVSGLTSGAQLGVVATGVFTEPLTNAASYLNYFVKLNENDTYKVVDNAIALESVSEMDIKNAIHTAAEKMTEDNVFAAGGKVTAVCPVCGTEEQWVEVTSVSNIKKITQAGHYYLADNVSFTGGATYIGFYADACLHLNGKNITSDERCIYVDATSTTLATLNIMGQGNVTGAGATNYRGTVDIGGTVNFYGGTYTTTAANTVMTARGYFGRSVVNIYDGAQFLGNGTSVCDVVRAKSQAINMYGGLITGGKGTNGGNVYVMGESNSAFHMYGGTVENGTATKGGNIYVGGTKGQLTINGGQILNGSVYVPATTFKFEITGAPTVESLDLTAGVKLDVSKLEAAAEIYVTADGVFTDTLTNAASYIGMVKAADKDSEVVVESNALAIRQKESAKRNEIHQAAEKMTDDGVFSAGGSITANCPVCEKEVLWQDITALGSNSITTAGHYYLSKDVTATAHYSFNADACFHLNGKTVNSSARCIVVNSSKLNVMGEGDLIGVSNYNSTLRAYCGVVDVTGNADFYGGTITATNDGFAVTVRNNKDPNLFRMFEGTSIVRTAEKPGPCVRIYDQGEFEMYGGLVSGGTATGEFGGNFTIQGGTGTDTVALRIYGGVIEKGTADKGGNIYAYGKTASLEICGGTVRDGEIYVKNDLGAISVSGAPVVSELDLSSGVKLTLGELDMGADITVTAPDGTFTAACVKAAKYVDYFKAAAAGKVITEEADVLVIG